MTVHIEELRKGYTRPSESNAPQRSTPSPKKGALLENDSSDEDFQVEPQENTTPVATRSDPEESEDEFMDTTFVEVSLVELTPRAPQITGPPASRVLRGKGEVDDLPWVMSRPAERRKEQGHSSHAPGLVERAIQFLE